MKFLKWLFIVAAVIVVGTISVIFIYLQSSRPVYHGEIHLQGLNQPVKIYMDSYGIPHIYGNSDADAYFALGYIHAQERLFQMELLRRVAAGRLAEILGKDLVKTDAFFRTLGIAKSAKESSVMFFSKPNEPWQRQTLAYLKGVNAFMFQGPTPPEFKLLGIPKVKFTPEDIYLITGYMAFSFAEALKTDPILDKISARFGMHYVNSLIPPVDSLLTDSIPVTAETNADLAYLTDEVFNAMPLPHWIGSNGWAIAPSRSASGKAMLANDTHIGYQQPAVWHEAHLEYPGFRIYGNYLAGMPFPLVGHNDIMGWGLTMFENDDMNLYREKVHQKQPDKYLHKGSWLSFSSRKEVIKIKSQPDTTILVRESIHGPVINDVIDQIDSTSKSPVAVWWTYTRFPASALQVTHKLANARNINDARMAASMVNAPGLNILYADDAGNIALWPSAKLPVYPKGLFTKVILDGSNGNGDIAGYYDFSQNPSIENPESGIIYTANQAPAPIDSMPYPGYYAPADRANRIRSLLESKDKWNLADLSKVALDATSLTHVQNASIILDVLQQHPVITKTSIHEKTAACLRNWKGTHALTDTAPTIYYKLLSNIYELSMKDEIGERDYQILVNTHFIKNSYTRFLSDANSPWWDDVNTGEIKENREAIFAEAFLRTVDGLQKSSGDMTNWTWGGIHTVEHIHPLGRKKPLDKIFNVGPLPVRGGIETINNAGFPLNTNDNFRVSYGPAMRKIFDFSEKGNGLSVLPTGQSGHLQSPHYNDQAALHVSGKYRPMMMNKEEITTKCVNILTLRPK